MFSRSKYFGLSVFVSPLIFVSIVHAQMPDCLSGICLGDIVSTQEFEAKGYEHSTKDCGAVNTYYMKVDNLEIEVETSTTTENDQKIDEIVNLERTIWLDPIHKLEKGMNINEWDKTIDKNVQEIAQIVIDKYGEPTKRFGGFKNAQLRFGQPKPGNEYSGKDVRIYKLNPSQTDGVHLYTIKEIIENRDHTDYYTNVFSDCRASLQRIAADRAEKEAKERALSVIPD